METMHESGSGPAIGERQGRPTGRTSGGVLVILAVVIAALVGFGAGWLVFRDGGNDDSSLLQSQADQQSERYDKTVAVQLAVRAILDDPTAYGSEEEVADLLASYATPSAMMEDDVFGSLNMRDAWYNTLYSGTMDAEIEVWHQWISDDGSQTSGLWVWQGTNLAGNPFELVGIAIDTHDEEGLITHELVVYPYSDEYVDEAVTGAGNVSG